MYIMNLPHEQSRVPFKVGRIIATCPSRGVAAPVLESADDTISEDDDPIRVPITSCHQSGKSSKRKYCATAQSRQAANERSPICVVKGKSAIRYGRRAAVQPNVESDEDDASENGSNQIDETPGTSHRNTTDGVEGRRPVHNYDEMLEVILKKQEESEKRLMKKIDSVKRSILYDIKNRMDCVITNIHSASGTIFGTDISKHEAVLGIRLPAETMKEFDHLEISLGVAEKRTAKICLIKAIMTVKTGKTQLSVAIGSITSHIMAKAIQLQYSAYGRKTFFGGKKVEKRGNFSATQSCKCMLEILEEAYGDSGNLILSLTSRWLSGAGDHKNGRAQRSSND